MASEANGKNSSVKRRAARAAGWAVARRLIKPIPIVGAAFTLGMAGYEIKRKGLVRGSLDVGLDLIPVVGAAKNIVELFTGDLIPPKKGKRRWRRAAQDGENE